MVADVREPGRPSFSAVTQNVGDFYDSAIEIAACHFFDGRDCGFRGRTGIHELMVTGDQIRELVTQRINANVIRREALKTGMITLRNDGWRKVQKAITTLDEVARVTAGDIIM